MSSATRSALMSRIRAKNTRPEMVVRRKLWARGFRFGLHAKRLAGKPDLVLPKWRAVVFVHGCFWHRHPDCPFFRLPKTRPEFWDAKLHANQQRDASSIASLRGEGWRVGVVWECAIRLDAGESVQQLSQWLSGGTHGAEIRARHGAVATEPLNSMS
ncbi:very short patch repair endonuclease [Stenotrophomonas rhizophila]|uniref:very short patch repair endonuclease n=1 Tax=Stenotrophomonas rhizophila TaxID=216778 RepID=UPI0021B41A27|nr:very short patch repair endonuclease [Stenotrophomonas rhizophila]